jgi:hypothetical protein
MNSSFIRSIGGNLLFGSLPKKERIEHQKALNKLLQEEGLEDIGKDGLGAVFILADKYLEGERIDLVLLRAILSRISWEKGTLKKVIPNLYYAINT